MPRLSITCSTVPICITTDKTTVMSPKFIASLYEEAKAYAEARGASCTLKSGDEHRVELDLSADIATAHDLFMGLTAKLNSMVEFGPDSPVFQVLLDKYPTLRDHPRFQELVGAFDMLIAKKNELLKDTTTRPGHATPVLPKASSTPAKSIDEVMRLREDQLRGNTPEQRAAAEAAGAIATNIATPDPKIVGVSVPQHVKDRAHNAFGS